MFVWKRPKINKNDADDDPFLNILFSRNRQASKRASYNGHEKLVFNNFLILGAAIAQWIRLCLPSCGPGFESKAHHLGMLLPFTIKLCALFVIVLRKGQTSTKRGRVWPIQKTIFDLTICSFSSEICDINDESDVKNVK